MTKQLKRMFERVFRQISSLITRGTIVSVSSQGAQVRFFPGEVKDHVPFLFPYGFASCPPPESSCIVISNGERFAAAIVAAAHGKQRTLKPGELELYCHEKTSLKLTPQGFVLVGDKIAVGDGSVDLLKILGTLVDAIALLGPTNSALSPLVNDINQHKLDWGKGVTRSR